MAKDTSSLKCRETVYGCSIRPVKALTNDGFRLRFDVVCTGFLPDHDDVRALSGILQKVLEGHLNRRILSSAIDDNQLKFNFPVEEHLF